MVVLALRPFEEQRRWQQSIRFVVSETKFKVGAHARGKDDVPIPGGRGYNELMTSRWQQGLLLAIAAPLVLTRSLVKTKGESIGLR